MEPLQHGFSKGGKHMSKNESKQPEKNVSEEKQKPRRRAKALTMEEFRKGSPNHPLLQPNSIIIGEQAKHLYRQHLKKKQTEETETGEANGQEKEQEE
jgi:hypothetical protein